jgi:hypothetical protein
MKRLAAVLLLGLTACWPFAREGDEEREDRPREPLTLCVRNETVAHGNIVARASLVRYDVMPGEQVCKRLIESGPAVELQAVTTGGGVAGPRRYSARLDTGGSRCWRWRLTDSPASAVDLMPCDLVDDLEGGADADTTAPADSSGARG